MSTDLRTWIALVAVAGLAGCDCEVPRAGERSGPVLVTEAGPGICPHPLFPLVKGATWSYELGEGERSRRTRAEIEVLEVTEQGRARTAKIRRTVGSHETTVEAVCGTDGASFLGVFIPLGPPVPIGIGANPTPTKRAGAQLPHPDRLREGGDEWVYELEVHTEIRGRTTLTMDSVWATKGHFLREREVTVPAGRYETTQLRYTVSVHHRPPEEEDVLLSDRVMDPPPMVFTYSVARGVGVVLIEGEPMPDRPDVRARWALTGLRGGAAGR